MKQTITPKVELDWGPVLWVAATMVALGLLVNFAVMRPSWIGFAALLAGVVASFRSGFYQSSGNNAIVGVILGILALTPVLVYNRVVFFFGVEGTGDTLFAAVALAGGWIIVVLMVLVPVAYIAAALTDFTRKKVGGPVGY